VTEWTDDALLSLFEDVVVGVRRALDGLDDWGLAGTRAGQYRSDLAADDVALQILDRAGIGVLSEESGLARADQPVIVVIDPVDGSTNASRGIPWFATSLCAVDGDGPRVAMVANQATGTRFTAVRGAGAWRDEVAISPSSVSEMRRAVVALSGMPPRWLGWKQYRALGAAALDLCAVASGMVDAYIDCSHNAHGSWDYLGGMLVCTEAGASIVDALDRDLVELTLEGRRTPVAAATKDLLAHAVEARRTF
jgi:fructose-1,6-bisphosphatase/inositol monophosphatase family enzyme